MPQTVKGVIARSKGAPVELTDIVKSFGPVSVLKGVNLAAYAGKVTALVGDNGAGKSTLIKGLAGVQPYDGGEVRFNGQPVMVIGHQKGRDTKEKIYRNFGMPKPEGYRKALRLMKLADMLIGCLPWPRRRRSSSGSSRTG